MKTMPHKKKSKKTPNTLTSNLADAWAKNLENIYKDWIYPSICNVKPPSKAQLKIWEKERIERERKEKIRRAKKITMTVGELEDKLEEARNDYDY